MQLTLTLTGTASQLALVMAFLENGAAPSPTGEISADDGEDGPVNAAAPGLDCNGLPWDGRIHAKTKVINADGSWRMRRNVDPATIASVEAALRAAVPAPVAPIPVPMPVPVAASIPVPMPVAAPVPVPMPVPVAAAPVPMPVAALMPVPMPVPVAAAPVVETPAPTGELDMPQFMQQMSNQMQKRDDAGIPLIHADYLTALTTEISNAFLAAGAITQPLAAFTDISESPQMIGYAVQLMQRDGRW